MTHLHGLGTIVVTGDATLGWRLARWLRAQLQDGWRWGPTTDPARKQHQDLLAWPLLSAEEKARRYTPGEAALSDGELPEAEKVKDRTLMRGIPQILAVAGYAVVKLREATTEAAGAKEAQP